MNETKPLLRHVYKYIYMKALEISFCKRPDPRVFHFQFAGD
jgi:hypothetical protein